MKMSDILNKFSNLKKYSETLRHEIRMFYVFDDYLGKNYVYFTSDDQCFAFGFNFYGCLGFGHNLSVEEPKNIPELSHKHIIDLYQGFNFMIGRTSRNDIYTWGQNEHGQLGLGFKSLANDFIKPERNEYLSGKQIIDISCGYRHIIALTSNGKVFGWGDNSRGQVGCQLKDSIIDKPVNLISLSSELVTKSISCGHYHSIAVSVDDFVFSWGDNSYGQLSTGDYQSSDLPKLVENLEINISKVISLKSSTYFLTKEGKIYYCGENYIQGIEGNASKPIELITNCDKHFIDISSGSPNYYCLAKTDESIYEIMKNELKFFETNHKNIDQYFVDNFHITSQTIDLTQNRFQEENNLIDQFKLFPQHLKNLIELFYVFDDIDGKNCIYVTKDNKVYAFGANYSGTLGIGNIGAMEVPVLIKELSLKKINQFYCGNGFMFAKSKDNVYCWGKNNLAQLGLGFESKYSKPVRNDFLSSFDIMEITCGRNHSLALTSNGDVYGWGDNECGQVGCGSGARIITLPTRIEIFLKVKSISCGDYHSLALTQGRSVFSWGKNDYGQLGEFWIDKKNAPSNIIDNNIISIASNHNNSYLLSKDGTLIVHGQIVRAFNTSTSQNYSKLPGLDLTVSLDSCICATTDLMIAITNETIYELRRNEIPIIKLGHHFTYNHHTINTHNMTHRPFHIINYEKTLQLGSGSFGNVFKCRDISSNQFFAVKVLNNQGLDIVQSSQIFNELQKLRQINCDHLVHFDNVWFETNDVICIQMKYFEHNLIALMLNKSLAFQRKVFQQMTSIEFCITLETYRQIIEGINFLHNLKPPIIHRYLKTKNIFIDPNDTKNFIKISDFGFHKFIDWGLTPKSLIKDWNIIFPRTQRIVENDSMIQLIQKQSFGLKTDIYCLAIIGEELFELGLFSPLSNPNHSKYKEMNQIIEVTKAMKQTPFWWLRPDLSEVLTAIRDVFPTREEILASQHFVYILDSLKNYKISLFFEIIQNLLQNKS